MNKLQSSRVRLIWPIVIDSLAIAFCMLATARTGNLGYLLIGAGLVVFTVCAYLRPVRLDIALNQIWLNRAAKWKSADYGFVVGIILSAFGLFVVLG